MLQNYSFFLSEAKSVVGVMLMIVFLLPASIIFAIYFILCHSTIKRSKEMLQESVINENSEPSKVKLKDSFISGLLICLDILETAKYFRSNTHQDKFCFLGSVGDQTVQKGEGFNPPSGTIKKNMGMIVSITLSLCFEQHIPPIFHISAWFYRVILSGFS